ncbi:MAG: HAD-IB family phosphatase [Candidatus Bathyarchaeota archaeon]|nr:MAG: HAD-IB family phosphatase [Candidatus Bathyarchaeota archaeon]
MIDTETGEARRSRLVVFDVEGVLLPKRRYLLFDVARKLSFLALFKILVIGSLYEIGLLSVESALRRIFAVYRGFKIDDLRRLFREVPLMPGAEHVFKTLNNAGYKTALISSGIPTLFVEDLVARLKANYAFGLELKAVNGHLTGEIEGDVLKPNGKARVLKEILRKEGLSAQDCVVVADERNNLQMFPLSTMRIGYNPDFILTVKSDYVVRDDLSGIIPIIKEDFQQAPRPIFSRNDIIREAIHMSGFFIPFICMHLLRTEIVALLIFLLASFFMASELLRLQGISFPIFSKVTWIAAKKSEFYEFATAPISFAVGIVFSLIFFPEPANYAAVVILALGDSFATIFGKKLGRIRLPFNKGKHVEGSVFGFLFAFAGALFFVTPLKAFAGAAAGMLIGGLPLPVDDNLTIPIAAGIVLALIP